ncbi:MAG: hypothetical protein LBD73_09000, partial [Deferribacteraceae bacterium]|nr:hypothetical protein [Deferribacteraceae bacterium]
MFNRLITDHAEKLPLRALFLFALFSFIVTGCETGGDNDSSLPLAAPTSIQATPKNMAIELRWTRVAKAQGIEPTFKVYYNTVEDFASATDSGLDPIPESEQTGMLWTKITNLANDTKYYIWVETYFGSFGKADFIPVTYATPVPPAEKPANVKATTGDTIIWLTWNKSP